MRTVDFYQYVQKFLEECLDTMQKKGDAYAGKDQDRFANFNKLAAKLDMSREKILMVYMQKHLDAIESFIRGEYADPEPISGRVKDVINYLLILAGMIKENTDASMAGQIIDYDPKKTLNPEFLGASKSPYKWKEIRR